MTESFDFSQMTSMLDKLMAGVQDIKENASQIQVEGKAGGDMVSVVMNGNHKVLEVHIAQQAMDDRELLEDLVVAAVNEAVRRLTEELTKKIGGFAEGLPIPPGMF